MPLQFVESHVLFCTVYINFPDYFKYNLKMNDLQNINLHLLNDFLANHKNRLRISVGIKTLTAESLEGSL